MGGAARCVIISGLSASGRSTALRALEDRGFYTVDNLPPVMLPSLMDVLSSNRAAAECGVAAVVDTSGGNFLNEIARAAETVEKSGIKPRLIFLDASDETLLSRYEATRRRHPMGGGVTTAEGITRERAMMSELREYFDTVVDTSGMRQGELRAALLSELEMTERPLTVMVSSFGFKNGLPRDCDYMFDARFLPNPNYVPDLKPLSGRDREVQEYLDGMPEKRAFMERLAPLMEFILKHYCNTGKRRLHVAVGCTGGRHRSVAIAEQLSKMISDAGVLTATNHRDIDLEGR